MTLPVNRHGLPIIYRPSVSEAAGPLGRAPKASEVTASAIVADIVSRGLAPGDRLPSESEMLENYSVSRETLREALRLLEVQGLVVLRRGPGGGPSVSPLNAAYLARSATLYFHLSGATYNEVFDTWEIVEPPLSAKVARIGDRKLKERAFAPFLGYQVSEHESSEVRNDLNNFHAVIAELSGNRVLTLVTQAITHIVVEHILATNQGAPESDELNHAHIDIAEAIINGWPQKAASLMQEHISLVVAGFREKFPTQADEPVQWL